MASGPIWHCHTKRPSKCVSTTFWMPQRLVVTLYRLAENSLAKFSPFVIHRASNLRRLGWHSIRDTAKSANKATTNSELASGYKTNARRYAMAMHFIVALIRTFFTPRNWRRHPAIRGGCWLQKSSAVFKHSAAGDWRQKSSKKSVERAFASGSAPHSRHARFTAATGGLAFSQASVPWRCSAWRGDAATVAG